MRHAARYFCLGFATLSLAGCACDYPPIFGRGAQAQNYNFGRFDPYPDRVAGPPLDGVRPPGADRQRSEPVRAQAPYTNSGNGALLVP